MNEIEVKSILNKTKRRDPWFLDDYTINPYSGCSFNCLYCYIRGSKYGEHMERKLSVKTNAPALLEKALARRAKKGEHGIIVLSSATDPYLQAEKETGLTRHLLEIILKYQFPVHMITKSDLIIRDLDLLKEIDQNAILPEDLKPMGRGALITFSFSTIEEKVAGIFEPGATSPKARLDTLLQCSDEGFLTGVSMMPLLPWISDTTEQLEAMFNAFKTRKAHYVFPAHLALYGNEPAASKTLVLSAIKKHYPKYLKKYESYFGTGNDMPDFYKKAFYKKMESLGKQYEMPNRIYELKSE
jgi:DNA repair photolyase